LSRCDSFETACERQQRLVQLGLSPDIIHIHPDNLPQQSIDEMYYAKKEYGMKVLGVYMGSSEYIQEYLDLKLVKLAKVKDDIINFSDKQVRNLMLRWSFCAKINHLLRTTPPTLMQFFAY